MEPKGFLYNVVKVGHLLCCCVQAGLLEISVNDSILMTSQRGNFDMVKDITRRVNYKLMHTEYSLHPSIVYGINIKIFPSRSIDRNSQVCLQSRHRFLTAVSPECQDSEPARTRQRREWWL